MQKDTKELIGDAALCTLFPQALLAKKLYELASEAIESKNLSQNRSTTSLSEEATRKELEQRIEQAKARIAQEYAIAARIGESETVEMEEHYEYITSANAGLSVNSDAISANLGGSIQRVSHRTYRFSGHKK